jgi:NUMOD1 domain
VKEFNGVTYYSLPEAAKIVGVTHVTMHNWATGRIPLQGLKLQVKYDHIKHQRFLSEETVNELKRRFPGGKLKKHKEIRKPYKRKDRTTLTREGTTYYSLPTAAKLMNVSHVTMYSWVTGKVALNGLKPEYFRDPDSRRYYVSEPSLQKLADYRISTIDVDPSQQLAAPHT